MTVVLPIGKAGRTEVCPRAAWQRSLALLGGVTFILCAIFWNDCVDLAQIWWTNTTFGHCLFIGPVIAWLVWQRRAGLAQLAPLAWAPGLALVALGGAGWLMGDAASVSLARQLGLVMMVQGAVVALLGPKVAHGLLFPLCYAFFLVPFGESIEPPLQAITVKITMALLHIAGVPARVDGVLITIPGGYFEVAAACSGSKFVIAMAAFGTLAANVCYIRWRRRLAFMAVAMIVPVLANGLRAFGTIYAAHLTSVEQATGLDHIIFGWVFFGLVMAAVLAMGWRWFDRDPDADWFDIRALQGAVRHRLDAGLAALLVLTVAAAFPAWGAIIGARTSALPARIALPVVPGWRLVEPNAAAPWSPYHPGADHFLIGRYADGRGAAVDLAIAVYGSQREGKELVRFGTGVLRQNDRWVKVADVAGLAGGHMVRITAPGPVERVVATWYRLGGTTTNNDRIVKLETLKSKLLGGSQTAVAVHLSAQVVRGVDSRRQLARFLAAMGPVERLADDAAGLPR
ncbi:MAG: exosortase A [Sphingomonas sp.]|jgi:exosortase A